MNWRSRSDSRTHRSRSGSRTDEPRTNVSRKLTPIDTSGICRHRRVYSIFIARQHSNADVRYCCSNAVRPSVCHVPVLYRNGLTYRHAFFFTIFPILNIFAKFGRGPPILGRSIQVGYIIIYSRFSIKSAAMLQSQPRSRRKERCHNFFLSVKNYPTLKFMLPLLVAAATTGVTYEQLYSPDIW